MKTTTYSHTTWVSKQLLEYFNFELLDAFNFCCTWNKEVNSRRWNFVTFRHNIPYMVNYFVFSLDIPLIINILYKMITILHETMLNAIYLYWFHSDALAENNSLNDHSNEHWINGSRFATSDTDLRLLQHPRLPQGAPSWMLQQPYIRLCISRVESNLLDNNREREKERERGGREGGERKKERERGGEYSADLCSLIFFWHIYKHWFK